MARAASSPEQKAMLENMAETWETLAKNRQETIARRRRIADLENNTFTAEE
ncbi:MAG: hypothetical protein WBD48_07285 [Pseudolabrys sp.]